MANIEVEHRGSLNQKGFTQLKEFLENNGKYINETDKFSVIYLEDLETDIMNPDRSIDLRLRIKNKKTELVMKHGKNSGKDARREFIFNIDSNKFEELIEVLRLLGHNQGVLQANKTFKYSYKDVEIALVEVPNWGYYFEAEITTKPEKVEEADKKIEIICKELNLKILNDENYFKLIKSLNSRDGFKFNLKKQDFQEIKQKFIEYF